MEAIIYSDQGYLSTSNAMKLTKLRVGECDDIIKHIVKEGWLAKEEGKLFFTAKSLLELQPYFKTVYVKDTKTCCVCDEPLFYKKQCSICSRISHVYCTKDKCIEPECGGEMEIV